MIGFYGPGFSMFPLFSILFILVFVIVLVIFGVIAVRGIRQWNRNNHSPRLCVEAAVVGKRTGISRHACSDDMAVHTTSTRYYATFQVESGDRMELEMRGDQYGLLVEGDRGKLTFQGNRYLGFERI